MVRDDDDNLLSSSDEELSRLPGPNILETRAHNMRTIARVGENLNRIKQVRLSSRTFASVR